MGNSPSRSSAYLPADVKPVNPESTQSSFDNLIMTDPEANPVDQCLDDSISDVEIQELLEEERALRAQADAIRAKKVEKLRAREAMQQAKAIRDKLLQEQQAERFSTIMELLRTHDTTDLTEEFVKYPDYLQALHLIVKGEHKDKHVDFLSRPLLGWLADDKDQWKAIAKQILAGNVDTSADESIDVSGIDSNIPKPTGKDDQAKTEAHARDTIVVDSNTEVLDTTMKDVEGLDVPTNQLKQVPIKVEKEASAEPMQPPAKRLKLNVIENDNESTSSTPSYALNALKVPSSTPTPSTPSNPLRTSMVPLSTPTSGRKTVQFAKADTVSGVSSPASGVSTPSKDKSDGKTPTPKKVQGPLINFERGLTDAYAHGTSVLPSLVCQACSKYPVHAKLTPCEHIYCDKCIISIRKAVAKSDKEATCVTCSKVLRRCHVVPKETIDEWMNKFADEGEDESETSDEEEADDETDDDDESEAEASE